jgi:hypothetical protein
MNFFKILLLIHGSGYYFSFDLDIFFGVTNLSYILKICLVGDSYLLDFTVC